MGIKVYMPSEMKLKYPQANAIGLEPMKKIRDGDMELTPFAVPHDGITCYAYIIRIAGHRIAWLTDLEYCPYLLKKLKLTDIFCECNYQNKYIENDGAKRNHVLRGHMELETAKGFVRANKSSELRNVILCHLSQDNAEPMECVEKIQKATGIGVNVDYARAGLEVELNKELF